MFENHRLITREVWIGSLPLGYPHPIRVQTMTTADTLDIEATVAECIRCAQAGAEIIRITAPSRKEAEALSPIRKALHAKGYKQPLVADIHFTPQAAEIAARNVEKVRINPGNYADKKKFEVKSYSDKDYEDEIARIAERFTPLVRICKEHGTAMRIGTNHGSLSDRIMSRYGDTPMGMVESALEFLRIARAENYHQIVLSMKSSNPLVMIEAYRLLVEQMLSEFQEVYPLHLGVTEAGDGDDGRIKSALGIGGLLEDGIGDTIRVSLTEDPEKEIPVCQAIIQQYAENKLPLRSAADSVQNSLPWTLRRKPSPRKSLGKTGGGQVPVVIAEWPHATVTAADLRAIGYRYAASLDKWHIGDGAADYLHLPHAFPDFALPGTLEIVLGASTWMEKGRPAGFHTSWKPTDYLALEADMKHGSGHRFLVWDLAVDGLLDQETAEKLGNDPELILCLGSSEEPVMAEIRAQIQSLNHWGCSFPIILWDISSDQDRDAVLIQHTRHLGPLIQDRYGDGIWLRPRQAKAPSESPYADDTAQAMQFRNQTAFSLLQASRTRISKTEYISCPSCGRTLFDLQETTARIRKATHHLKGVKIAIMGCIVNGPGEMADADFGYVGSGPGKITLYKGKEVVRRQVPAETAVDALIDLLKENQVWVEPAEPESSTL